MKYAILKDREIIRFEESDCMTKLSLNTGEYPYACYKANFQIGDKIYLPHDDTHDFVLQKPNYNLWRKVGWYYIVGTLILAASFYFLRG